jgi:chromosome segregation ATPase
VLYLAEVKIQSRGFVGGYKTELKLLASQGIDQTWNTVTGEEIIATDTITDQTGKGTLYIVNLDNNKQLQGNPELAGSRVVNYLRHFSRTLEKSKSQEREIEQWKTSLKIQGEEISRRQAELDQQQQILQQQQLELAKLEEDKNKLNGAWEQLRAEQQRVNENQSSQGEIKGKLQNLLTEVDNSSFDPENLHQVFSGINTQQNFLDNYWQQLQSQKVVLQQKQQELDNKKHHLEQCRQNLRSLQDNLQKAIIRLQSEEILLQQKEDSLRQLNTYLEGLTRLDQEISFLGDDNDDIEIDLNALEVMPLGDLEETVNNLKQETSKLVNFVNLQEEELTLQSDEVKLIQVKLIQASEVDKFNLETELADAQEAMKLLNETLVGQRRTLKRQQKMLNDYLKIFSRRKGIIDLDFANTINIRPVLDEVETQKNFIQQQRDKLNDEINALRHSNAQVEHIINGQKQEYEQQQIQINQEEEYWLQSYQDFTKTQTEINLLEQTLNPIQEQLNHIRNNLQALEQSTQKFGNVFNELQSML